MNEIENFTDLLDTELENSQPFSLSASSVTTIADEQNVVNDVHISNIERPPKHTGERQGLRSVEEIDPKYRDVFSYKYFNSVQTQVIEDALYSDKSLVVCAPTGSGKTVIFEMAIVQLLMEMEEKNSNEDFKIIYMAPIKALCTERLTEWYSKFTKFNLLCIEVTGDTDVDFSQLKPYKIIITTPEKWDMLTRRWRDYRGMVEVIKLFLIDEVHILNDVARGPVLEAVVSRMKTIQSSLQSAYRIEQLKKRNQNISDIEVNSPKIRFVAVSATVSNPEDVAEWLGTSNKLAVFHKFGDECRPVKLKRVVEGYPCPEGSSIFKFDIVLNYKLWPIIQRYHDGKPTLIFCNTRKSVILTAEALSHKITIKFTPEQNAKLTALASSIKTKKIQSLALCGIGCHHAGLLYEDRLNIERAFRNSDLPILITTTTLAMGVNLPAHLVIIKNTQQYVNGTYQEYSISTVLQMVGRAGRPQFDTEATAVIMTRLADKARYQALVGGCEPLQSFLHKRLAENLNSEAALGTVCDLAQCVQWVRSTFLFVRAARDPKKYLGLPHSAPTNLISKKIEELCVKAINGLSRSGLITMDELSCIQSTEAGRLLSIYYLDLETMKNIMKIKGDASLEQLLWIVCESHELSDMHLRVDERRYLNALNRKNTAATIRYSMKGKISTRQMKLNCLIQAVLGCLPIHDPSLNQEAIKIMRIADRICKCLVSYLTRPYSLTTSPQNYQAVFNAIVLAKCMETHLWENSIYVSKQLKGIGPTFSTLLASAGKINFMLLEESHPRDLERIMNKGPPAGNVLRKQISLLPKYQLTITPVDENSIKIQLVLLNQMYLAENMDHLTAGANHRCYIVIGDSENYLLLLASFKDKDLITIYNGEITYEILRRHNFEHKIMAHCISSNFAGIDVQCEYIFRGLDKVPILDIQAISPGEKAKSRIIKQTSITDTFNIRKRKNFNEMTVSSKRQCEFPIIDKIKSFTQSVDKSLNVIETENKEIDTFCDVQQDNFDNNNILKDDDVFKNDKEIKGYIQQVSNTATNLTIATLNDLNDDEGDDERINIILSEIEKEILEKTKDDKINKDISLESNAFSTTNKPKEIYGCEIKRTKFNEKFGNKQMRTEKTNFNVIDKIQKKANNMKDNDIIVTDEQSTFVNNVKSHIDEFMSKIKQSNNITEKNIINLFEENSIEPLYEDKTDRNQHFSLGDEELLALSDNISSTNGTSNINENDKAVSNLEKTHVKEQLQELQKKDHNCTYINDTFNATENNRAIFNNENKCKEHLSELKFKKLDDGDSNYTNTKGSNAIENNIPKLKYKNVPNVSINPKKNELEKFQNELKNNTISSDIFNIGKKQLEVLNYEDINDEVKSNILNINENFKQISDLENIEYYKTKDCVLQEVPKEETNRKEQNSLLKSITPKMVPAELNNVDEFSVKYVNPYHYVLATDNRLKLNESDTNKKIAIDYSNIVEKSKDSVSTLTSIACKNDIKEGEICIYRNENYISKEEDSKEVLLETRGNEASNSPVIKNNNIQRTVNNLSNTVRSSCEYTKKFSYTKTHFNICTTNNLTTNYCVVSKVKIDLDIIKNDTQFEKDDFVPVEKELSDVVLKNKSNVDNKTDYIKIDTNEIQFENDMIAFKSPEEYIKTAQKDQGTTTKIQKEFEKNLTLLPRTSDEINEKTQTIEAPFVGNLTVKDTINKYKKLASSKNIVSGIKDRQILSSATSSNNTKNNEYKKIKRPFKIKDLDKKVEIKCQNPIIQLVTDTDRLKSITKLSESTKDETDIIKYENPNEFKIEPDINYPQCENFDDLESTDLKSSDTDSMSPDFVQAELFNDDLDLSQSMFNPRSLLECSVQDDIILPPTQFRDEPERNSQEIDEDHLNILNREKENAFDLDDTFENSSPSPSTEIETWTLSGDDEPSSSIYKSINREPCNRVADYLQTTPSRKLKLNEFKFQRKKMLNIRK